MKRLQMAEYIITNVRNNNPTWTRTLIKDTHIGDDDALALAGALEQNNTLTSITLNNNRIGEDGARVLARTLSRNTTLTTFRMFHNPISDNGALAFADMLSRNTTLRELFLNTCRVGEDGAIALANALKRNDTLQYLDLSNNLIGDNGLRAISDMLRRNNTITRFYFSGNRFGLDGARALAKVIAMREVRGTTDRTMERISFSHSNVALERFIDEEITNTRIKYNNARRSANAYLIINKRARKGQIETDEDMKKLFEQTPKDIYILHARYLWDSRDDDIWLYDQAERDARGAPAAARAATKKLRPAESCLGCLIGTPVFHEQHNPTRRFCSAYCQLIHYHNLPDVRGMTPAQIELALA